jgi:HD-GYP domain-containing protein (c-di-GMP phosphodiesterase class II)
VFDRLTILEDLVDCRGAVVAPRGTVISPEAIEEAAETAPQHPRARLSETPIADDLGASFAVGAYEPLFGRRGAREAVERTLLTVELPLPLVDELRAMREELPDQYRHALLTAAVSVRILRTAVGSSRTLTELAAAALLHDVGMRQIPARMLAHRDRLSLEQVHRIAAHPLLGAYHLASVLGHHPAVAAARCHHWRCGQGYPGLASAPARSIEVIAIASAFCALTQPRPYRSSPFDARGAVDVLVRETVTGHADPTTVRLLVHALRGGDGSPVAIRFGISREGHAPRVNGHSPVAAPARSPL